MKKRIFGLLAALALSLVLLPGTARAAEGDTGVSINNVTLTSGKFYVAAEDGNGVTEADATPESGAYLAYTDGTLTVYGAFTTTALVTVGSDLTITGAAGSSLTVTLPNSFDRTAISINTGHTLTLDGGVDFIARSQNPYRVMEGPGTFTAAEGYSGSIAISNTNTLGSPQAVGSATLDVKNSGSITITGTISSNAPVVLNSKGDVSITSKSELYLDELSIKGANVKLVCNNDLSSSSFTVFVGKLLNIEAAGDVLITNKREAAGAASSAIWGSAVISAGGHVTISSNSCPIEEWQNPETAMTIKKAQAVSITGVSGTGGGTGDFFCVPVTFEDCGSVTVTDTGSGSLMSNGITVTSNCPWTATTGGNRVTIPSGEWHYGGALAPYGPHFIESYVTTPTAYKAGEGCALYTPGDNDTGTPAKLTLDGASYNGTINIQQAKSVQLELKGTNEVKSVNTAALTLTGNGSFEGKLETGAFTNSSTAALNAVVIVSVPREGAGTAEFVSQTVYGNRKTSDINVSGVGVLETTALTIAAGAALTVDDMAPLVIYDFGNLTNKGTIVNEGDIQILLTEKPQGTPDFGTVVNNGVVTIYPVPAVDITGEEMSAFIKGLKLTGTGTVTVEKTVNGSTVTETYTNSGLKQLEPAGDRDGKLDLRDAAPTEEENAESWAKYGYKWTDVVKDETSGNITSAKLTLAPGFNAEKVVLPDAEVEIVSGGECTIGTLTPPELAPGNAPADKTNLTLSGLGPLNIQNHVEISGGQGNRLTVAEYARVQVTGGVTVGSSGAVDGLVTVNGTLIAAGGGGTALSSGNVVVGGSGTLKVSGDTGVSLAGKSDPDFHGALTIQPGGRLEADCTGNAVEVTTGSAVTFDDYEAGDILVFPSGYLPQDRQPQFNEDKTSLSIPGGRAFTISSDNVPTPPPPSHRHKWAEGWTTSATHHWHNCTASGCPVTADSEKNGYGQHAYDGGWDADCNVCGYTRSLSSSDSSGSSGSSSHGGGGSRPTSPITVEPSEHGTVTSDRSGAVYGGPVTLTVRPDSGYELESLTVTDRQGNKMKLSALGGGKYAFTMPGGAVTVKAVFAPLADSGACDGGAACPSRAFTDLKSGAWYHEAVDFVLRNGLMNGYGNGGSPAGSLFGPEDRLSRAQFAQILYNKEGRPAGAGSAPFTDVAPDAWCAPAIAWAAERGIAGGYGNGTFGPDDPITREQLAVMLWRYAGSPAAPGGELSFIDAEQIGAHAREAICWAVESGVMSGKSGGVLDPKGFATRAQTAQMLKNFLENG